MILSKKISKKITDTLATNEIIESQKKAIYFYCLDFARTLYPSYQPAYSYNLGAGSSWKCTQALHHCRKNKNQKNIVLSVILYLRICSPHAIMETATLLSYDIDLLVHRSYQSMYRTLLES